MCSPKCSNSSWKVVYSGVVFILWFYGMLLCLVDIRDTWQKGYGRITYMLDYSVLPPSIPAIPLVVGLPVLLCLKYDISMVTVGLSVLAGTTFCVCLTMTVIREQSLTGLKNKLQEDLRDKYGHGISNELSNLVFTQSMDFAQYTFKCCGVNGGEDYNQSAWYQSERTSSNTVPPACCVPETRSSNSNISHSGTPINVVMRSFYGMLEEGWQNPQPKFQKECQSKNYTIFKSARYTTGCLKFIVSWVKSENLKSITLDGILIGMEVLVIMYCLFMPRDRVNVNPIKKIRRNKKRKCEDVEMKTTD